MEKVDDIERIKNAAHAQAATQPVACVGRADSVSVVFAQSRMYNRNGRHTAT